MTTPPAKCAVCQRDPQRANSDFAECSHVDCRWRHLSWQKPLVKQPPAKQRSPLDKMFERVDD